MTVTKDLLYTYFSGQATPLQKKMIADWLSQSGNQELYFQWLEEWERRVPQYAPDIDTAVSRFQQRLENGDSAPTPASEVPPTESGRPRRIFHRPWLWAAAAVVVLSVLGYTSIDRLRYKTYTTEYGQTSRFLLPDSSTVTLNGHSELRIPRFGFGRSTRRVQLIGEAVFDVKHTVTNQRFLVQTPGALEVEVLGTEFSVMARPHGTQIALNRGKVELHYHTVGRQPRRLVMKPGDWVALSHQGQLKRGRHEDPKKFAAWRDERFVFDATPLQEVVLMVKETYGLTVRFSNDSLATRKLNGTFHARTSDDLLEALAQLLDLQITRTRRSVILSPATTPKL